MAAFRSRTIIESAEFAAERDRIQPITSAWDAFWFGFDWVLSHDPEAGAQVFALPYWILTTEPSPGMPRLRVLYEYDDDSVTLLAIAIDPSVPDVERSGS